MQAAQKPLLEPRNSNGLDQFVAALQERLGPQILDLSGANQWNLDFLSARGRLTSDEFSVAVLQAFGTDPATYFENQSDPERVEQFCRLSLDYRAGTFDAILVWDALEYLGPELLEDTISHLYDLTFPGAALLCYFHADQSAVQVPIAQYRILDAKTIQVATRSTMRPTQFYSNRAIEKIFQKFQSVKFFLTRDHLREVIVRR